VLLITKIEGAANWSTLSKVRLSCKVEDARDQSVSYPEIDNADNGDEDTKP